MTCSQDCIKPAMKRSQLWTDRPWTMQSFQFISRSYIHTFSHSLALADPSCMSEVIPITHYFVMTRVILQTLVMFFVWVASSSLAFVVSRRYILRREQPEIECELGALHVLIVGAFNRSAMDTRPHKYLFKYSYFASLNLQNKIRKNSCDQMFKRC